MSDENSRLILAIRSGDERAFEQLFFKYYEALARFACQYVDSMAAAEGLVQDVYANIWEMRSELDKNINIRSYLYSAVKNKGLDRVKHTRVVEKYENEVQIQLYELHDTVEESVIAKEGFIEATQNAIEELPDKTRRIYKLNRNDGLTYPEIANILNLSVKSIEYHMSKALKILRDHLSQYLPGLTIFSIFRVL